MSYVFFDSVLSELNHKLTFDAVANYAGNGFFEKSWDLITQHHPLQQKDESSKTSHDKQALTQLAGLFG